MGNTDAIQNKLTDFYNAFNAKDWTAVGEHLSEEFSYFTDNGTVQAKADFLAFMKSNDWQGESFGLDGLKITASESLAVATYQTTFEGVSNGTKMKFSAIETMVFKPEQHTWKIHHFHTSNKMG